MTLKIYGLGLSTCTRRVAVVHLYESRAIARHLAKKYADQGTPDLVPTEFEPRSPIRASSLYGRQTDEARVAELAATLDAELDGYEVILGNQQLLASDNLTLADPFHLPAGSTLVGYAHLLDKRPNVTRWWNGISSRPTWLALEGWCVLGGRPSLGV
ncbi:hypothetical protein BV22DRAFT_1115527 [Leucogyrophana mollusca]|uniref:Uncharacterized protein n=1 Tax=Leucogyrophana mollusca TaxID=85980 RepID=A0ACB8AX93_9AGAM|nr:hypothetical protein BV22DRAFT_1115527 [Leucogyrophana mollusca]